jgi:hypothetical protein
MRLISQHLLYNLQSEQISRKGKAKTILSMVVLLGLRQLHRYPPQTAEDARDRPTIYANYCLIMRQAIRAVIYHCFKLTRRAVATHHLSTSHSKTSTYVITSNRTFTVAYFLSYHACVVSKKCVRTLRDHNALHLIWDWRA